MLEFFSSIVRWTFDSAPQCCWTPSGFRWTDGMKVFGGHWLMRDDEVFSFCTTKSNLSWHADKIFLCSAKQSIKSLEVSPLETPWDHPPSPSDEDEMLLGSVLPALQGSSVPSAPASHPWRPARQQLLAKQYGSQIWGGWQLKQVKGGGGVGVGSARSDVILHGENQTRAATQQLLLTGVQLALQRLLGRAAAPFSVCAPAQLSGGVRSARRAVGRDGSIAKHEGQVGVAVDQVRVWVPQLLVILKTNAERSMSEGCRHGDDARFSVPRLIRDTRGFTETRVGTFTVSWAAAKWTERKMKTTGNHSRLISFTWTDGCERNCSNIEQRNLNFSQRSALNYPALTDWLAANRWLPLLPRGTGWLHVRSMSGIFKWCDGGKRMTSHLSNNFNKNLNNTHT